jgi:hypothetical protein
MAEYAKVKRLAPGFRVPFGHRHETQEEVGFWSA